MKIEDLLLTVEQSKHLQELGLDMSDAAFESYEEALDEGIKEALKLI